LIQQSPVGLALTERGLAFLAIALYGKFFGVLHIVNSTLRQL
jgi:hypothetical protein